MTITAGTSVSHIDNKDTLLGIVSGIRNGVCQVSHDPDYTGERKLFYDVSELAPYENQTVRKGSFVADRNDPTELLGRIVSIQGNHACVKSSNRPFRNPTRHELSLKDTDAGMLKWFDIADLIKFIPTR